MLFCIPTIDLRYQNELLHCIENLIFYTLIDSEYIKIYITNIIKRQRSVSFSISAIYTHIHMLKKKITND